MIYEDLHSSKKVKSIPVDIENTFIGKDIGCLIETISGPNSLHPYSDVSLRVLTRIADILQNRHFTEFYRIDKTGIDVGEELVDF